MCELYSWIEKDGDVVSLTAVVFLTARDVYHTERGKDLQKHTPRREDWHGHGAIRWPYNFTGGINKECTDLSSPSNFPIKLQKAILTGKMWKFGITEGMASGMLLAPALAKYKNVCATACAEYKNVCATALAEYKNVCATAWAEYVKVCATAWAELFSNKKNRKKAWR